LKSLQLNTEKSQQSYLSHQLNDNKYMDNRNISLLIFIS
jgi:hypothetical protein